MGMFTHLMSSVTQADAPQPYVFDDLETAPTAYFRPATEDNKDYAAALLKLSARRAKIARKNKGTSLATISSTRSQNQMLVAKFCITGWDEAIKDTQGNPVEFTQERALEFLKALPHWMFDRLYNWLTTPENFIKDPTDDIDDEDGDMSLDEFDEILSGKEDEPEETLGKPSAQ